MKKVFILFGLLFVFLVTFAGSCDNQQETQQPKSASGVKKVSVKVQTDSEGMTVEQSNISKRLNEDNKPGAIKHLYIISAYSGQVIIYSTVKGKITSSGKRLTPRTVAAFGGDYNQATGVKVSIGGEEYQTNEVLEDDGAYGDSIGYIYWWDTKGVFHQHFVSGGQIIHISSEPVVVKSVIINMDLKKD